MAKSITKIVKNSKEDLNSTQIESLKMAAQLWAQNHYFDIIYSECRYLSVNELI